MLVICLPTYNERRNLEPMVRALAGVARDLERETRVLVIDDASPDGTGALADRLTAELDFLHVVHRPRKDGLGPAYLAGFRWALDAGAELVAEMDCDFSHDPAALPRLVAAVEDADVVLGSRYVPGGETRRWSALRRAVSRAGSAYARLLLGVDVRDLTGGFKCYRREVLETIGIERISAKGYAFQIETTYRAIQRGFRVVEVPITFVERTRGSSKMGGTIVVEAAVRVPLLRLAAMRGRL